jgi:hypothetical protein
MKESISSLLSRLIALKHTNDHLIALGLFILCIATRLITGLPGMRIAH